MNKLQLLALTLAALSGCAEFALMGAEDAVNDLDTGAPDDVGFLRIDVYPPPQVAGVDLLPQTFVEDVYEPLDLVVAEPAQIAGRVTAWRVSPWAGADLPGEAGPVDATVSLKKLLSVQSPFSRTDELGDFGMRVIPDLGFYELTVVPDDPAIPMLTELRTVEGNEPGVELELGYGVPVWGVVATGADLPLAGVRVHALTESGTRSASAVTDAEGRYLLRLQPGAEVWIVSEGRSTGRDPVIFTEFVQVGDEGLRRDIEYASLEFRAAGGRVVGPSGQPVDGVTVRFTSQSLAGYTEAADHVVEVRPTQGNFDTRLLAGHYDVDVIPGDGLDLSPLAVGEVITDGSFVDLGTLALEPLFDRVGRVVDPDGVPVPGATLTWTELGFGMRTWSTVTDDVGAFTAQFPNASLDFTLTPPASRADLPLTRLQLEPGPPELEVAFHRAEVVTGVTRYSRLGAGPDDLGSVLAYAVVEIRDDRGRLLGIAISDDAGRFTIPVAFAP